MSDNWSREELRASVEAYVDMQRKQREGEPFTKKRCYQGLSARFGRTEKAFEYRMQNISYVLTLLGRDWLPGVKPAKNVGARVAAEIEQLLAEVEGRSSNPVAEFEVHSRELRQKPLAKPAGAQAPTAISAKVTQYRRSAEVKAWVLREARGTCEACKQGAPFNGSDGQPYLEVHHVRQLADGGSDTTENAVALCPNCHREMHYGERSKDLIARLYKQVSRLVRE